MTPQSHKRLRAAVLFILLAFAVLAGVGIMIDAADDSDRHTAVPQPEGVEPSPPNDTSIGEEAGPYR